MYVIAFFILFRIPKIHKALSLSCPEQITRGKNSIEKNSGKWDV